MLNHQLTRFFDRIDFCLNVLSYLILIFLILTYDPTSTFFALNLWIMRVLVEIEVEENTRWIDPFLAWCPGVKFVKVDRVFAASQVCKV